MASLETLSFEFNRLEQVEADAFKGLTNLKNMSFNWNKLKPQSQIQIRGVQIKIS
jgi:hypothetical protein